MPTIKSLIFPLLALLTPLIRTATIAQVISTNSALITQADQCDASIWAITSTTPTATEQQVPTTLQSLNLAIVSAQSSLTPTTATSDTTQEFNVARSFGLLANTIEDLAADLILQEKYLSPVPNLQHDTYNQIGYMNTNFRAYTTFSKGLVTDSHYQNEIQYNSDNATALLATAYSDYA